MAHEYKIIVAEYQPPEKKNWTATSEKLIHIEQPAETSNPKNDEVD